MKLESNSVVDSEYIASSVATEKVVRSRGYMRQLSDRRHWREEKIRKKHPFTFLMRQQKQFTARMIFDIYIIRKQMELDSDVFFDLKKR